MLAWVARVPFSHPGGVELEWGNIKVVDHIKIIPILFV